MDAPDFELSTPKVDLSDALQAELSDSISGFELDAESAAQKKPRHLKKPRADDNDAVVAALLGKPLAAKSPDAEKAVADAPVVEPSSVVGVAPKPAAGESILAAMLGKSVSSTRPIETAETASVYPPPPPAENLDTQTTIAPSPEIAEIAQRDTAEEALDDEVLSDEPILKIVPTPIPATPIYPKLVSDSDDEEAEQIDPLDPAPEPDVRTKNRRGVEFFEPVRVEPKPILTEPPPRRNESMPAGPRENPPKTVVIEPAKLESRGAAKLETEPAAARPLSGAWWTLPLMFAGLAIVACAVLIPAGDENRRAMYELAKIDRDVAYFQKQSDVNKDFLERVSNDPTLAERLALRQLHMTRTATHLVPVPTKAEPFNRSPSALVSVEPPPLLAPYRPVAGKLGEWFLNVRLQMYLVGAGVLLAAAGVILGGGEPTSTASEEI